MTNARKITQKEINLLKTEAKSSRNKLRSFFDSSSAIHLLIDTSLRLIDFNRAAFNFMEKYHKIRIQAGSLVTGFLHRNHIESFKRNYKRAIKGIPIRTQQELSYDGKGITWFITYEPAWDCEGKIIGISFNAVDITEKLANERKIVSQHRCLQEIAYIQSHKFRRPVSNIIGLMKLFTASGSKCTKAVFDMLQRSVNELETEMLVVEQLSALNKGDVGGNM
jgi:PAS domain S-box-containing protein